MEAVRRDVDYYDGLLVVDLPSAEASEAHVVWIFADVGIRG